jgi:putative ABC transport system permease protein
MTSPPLIPVRHRSAPDASTTTGLSRLLFLRFTLRHWQRSPRQAALLVILLSLGIGVYFSVRLANRAAVSSFKDFTDLITSQSDWVLTAPMGTLPEEVLTEIRHRLGPRPVVMVPVVATTASPPRGGPDAPIASGLTYTVYGIDLVAIRNGAPPGAAGAGWLGQGDTPEAFWNAFQNPRSVFVSERLAKSQHLKAGSSLPVVLLEQLIDLQVAGIIPPAPGRPEPPESLLVMDLPALQALSGKQGRLDRIELLAEPGYGDSDRRAAIRQELESMAANRWIVTTPTDRRAAGEAMTRAFRLNLTLLSLIALMVGLYLVFQALDGAVVRRREEIAILRSLGVEERSIYKAWIHEALILGIFGGALGLGIGWLGAQGAVQLVGRTVNALYFANSTNSAQLTFGESIGAFVLSIGASLLAGWWPARVAAQTPPAQVLVRHRTPTGSRNRRLRTLVGVVFAVGAVLLALLPPYRVDAGFRVPAAGYVAAFLGVMGAGLCCGELVRWVARASTRIGDASVPARLALSQLRIGTGRHDLAAASLVWAVAMTSGMAILVGSFDFTMRSWIERTFQADLYVSSAGAQSASSQNRISPGTWRAIVNHPGVLDSQVIQVADIHLADGPTILVGADVDFIRRHKALAWLSAPPDSFFQTELNEGMALASESFLERFQKKLGDKIEVPTSDGIRELRISGTFADYGNERGSLTMDRHHMSAWVQDELATSLILNLKPGTSAETVRSELLAQHPGLQIFTNGHLRTELLRIFRQTFSITYALELIGMVVAVAGLALTLVSVLLERRSESTTLRALGMSPKTIAASTAWEGGLLAAVGSLTGLAASVALGALLVYVINKQAFGWTLQFAIPWTQMAALGCLVTVAASSAAYAVGRWGSFLPSDRDE